MRPVSPSRTNSTLPLIRDLTLAHSHAIPSQHARKCDQIAVRRKSDLETASQPAQVLPSVGTVTNPGSGSRASERDAAAPLAMIGKFPGAQGRLDPPGLSRDMRGLECH